MLKKETRNTLHYSLATGLLSHWKKLKTIRLWLWNHSVWLHWGTKTTLSLKEDVAWLKISPFSMLNSPHSHGYNYNHKHAVNVEWSGIKTKQKKSCVLWPIHPASLLKHGLSLSTTFFFATKGFLTFFTGQNLPDNSSSYSYRCDLMQNQCQNQPPLVKSILQNKRMLSIFQQYWALTHDSLIKE